MIFELLLSGQSPSSPATLESGPRAGFCFSVRLIRRGQWASAKAVCCVCLLVRANSARNDRRSTTAAVPELPPVCRTARAAALTMAKFRRCYEPPRLAACSPGLSPARPAQGLQSARSRTRAAPASVQVQAPVFHYAHRLPVWRARYRAGVLAAHAYAGATAALNENNYHLHLRKSW